MFYNPFRVDFEDAIIVYVQIFFIDLAVEFFPLISYVFILFEVFCYLIWEVFGNLILFVFIGVVLD